MAMCGIDDTLGPVHEHDDYLRLSSRPRENLVRLVRWKGQAIP